MMKTVVLGIGILLTLSMQLAHAQKTYKWVDEQGNVTYQDQPPPDDVQVLDQIGLPVPGGEPDPESPAPTQTAPRQLVILYAVGLCDACDLTRNLLQKNGIQFVEKDVNDNVEVQKELKALIGQLSVPVVTVGEQVVSGYSRTALSDALITGGYVLDGNAESGQSPTPEQANPSAEELVADTDDLFDSADDTLESDEEIPEDEQIKIPDFNQ